jgi:hypothetical protein
MWIKELEKDLHCTENLLVQCREEMLDPEFSRYQHGTRATRVIGCNGPMCRKAARDYGRELQRRLNGAIRENRSPARMYDDFLAEYVQFATEQYRALDQKPGRRKLTETRVIRQDRVLPLATVRELHAKRVGLAS